MKWKYGACGEYMEYKGYIIIKQDHPKLSRYEVCREAPETSELLHIDTADTIREAKAIIPNQ